MGAAADDTDTAARLAQKLRAALVQEEPRAVEALLTRGADPNLVLQDGAAALHLAARARRRRALCCLGALLRRGGDPNARSTEALTPLHVAAAWGCLRSLELLLRHGADPTLRDQDGLRPLDLAEQQGHAACARVLRGLCSPGYPVTLEPTSHQVEPKCGDMGLGPSREVSSPAEPLEAAGEDGDWDSSSNEAFVTAVEVSGSEDTALERNSVGDWSLPQAEHGPMQAASPGPLSEEAELSSRLWAMTLSPPRATFFPPLPATGTAHSCSQQPSFCPLAEEQLSLVQATRLSVPESPFLQLCDSVSPPIPDFSQYSPELAEALRTGCIPDSQADEDALAQQFKQLDPAKKWREGTAKSSFTYLLLDPRETQDLTAQAFSLTLAQCLQSFARAIFYVGKGTRTRPDAHLWEALGYRGRPARQACPKVRRILDIWASGRGVVSLHCFQHVVAMEAYTREACLVDALGVQMLTNQKQGHYYGTLVNWPAARRRRLGVYLLYRALLIFLAEGERELQPQDIQARG
uniref:Ankyrin repeat and LEM domain containing 1 n=1 Tax=Cavia porcellus TaxID=10141 RepID=H0V8Y0_CAVPO